jgi:hypothetical protein
MNLKKLNKQSIIYPGYVLLIIATVYSLIFNLSDTQSNHEHMYFWYEKVVMDIVAAIFFSLIIGALSVTIFLNNYNSIYKNRKFSMLTWFLFSFSFIALVIGKAINEYMDVNSIWELIYALLASSPFVIGLIRGYIKFKTLNNVNL